MNYSYNAHMRTFTESNRSKPNLLQILWSMMAAFFGVQSNRVHDRDADYIDEVGFLPYIIVGVILAVVFVLGIYAIVQIILRS